MRKQLIIILTASLYLGSCAPSQSISSNSSDCHHPSENAVLWQQTAAEYDALCHQAFNIAKLRLQQSYQAGDDLVGNKPPAIIMDLDETVIDNSPYNAMLAIKNQSFSDNTWNEWVESANAEFIPGALEFIDFAQNNGVEIFFISNREERTLEATKRVLNEKGLGVNPEYILLKNSSSEKASRRQQVLQTHTVIMLIGDNLADFNDVFEDELDYLRRKDLVNNELNNSFGLNYIILPNPMYGDWEKSLDNSSTKGINNADRKGNLKFLKTF